MIYTIGIHSLFKEFETTVQYVLDYFKDKEEVQFDTETTGLDCHYKELMCFQLGDKENQFVINQTHLSHFKEFLETKTLIAQNAKFDLKFLYKRKIHPTKVYDTFLAESVLNCGYSFHKKSLAAIAKARLGVDIDKTVRDKIWEKGLSPEVVSYAANDVVYLEDIKASQEEEAKIKGLTKTIYLENKFVLVLAYIEYCGFKLDRKKWQEKCDLDLIKFNEARAELDQFIIDNNIKEFIHRQLDLFTEGSKVAINWDSPKQVAQLFKYLKIPISASVDVAESVGEKTIAKFEKEFPIIGPYLRYKGYAKLIGTYGENFFRHINRNTGRIHTQFKQLMDTGRLSSGGKNKETGEEYINFQNIPSDKFTRSCFVAEEGNVLLISDYSGQEQVVLANKSLDPALLEFYDKGMADMHSFVASKMFPELEGLSFDEIKDKHKSKRQSAKTAGFAINYGGNGSTIARNNNVSEEEGAFIYNSYFEAFSGLRDYFKIVQHQVLTDGYVLINSLLGRKCYIPGYDNFQAEKLEFDNAFWRRYKEAKKNNSSEFPELKEKISKWFKFKGKMERMALNYPIQGTSADITKISGIYFLDWIRTNNLWDIVLFVNTIHDENVIECPLEMQEDTVVALRDSMNNAADIFCKRVKLTAEPEPSLYWKK